MLVFDTQQIYYNSKIKTNLRNSTLTSLKLVYEILEHSLMRKHPEICTTYQHDI